MPRKDSQWCLPWSQNLMRCIPENAPEQLSATSRVNCQDIKVLKRKRQRLADTVVVELESIKSHATWQLRTGRVFSIQPRGEPFKQFVKEKTQVLGLSVSPQRRRDLEVTQFRQFHTWTKTVIPESAHFIVLTETKPRQLCLLTYSVAVKEAGFMEASVPKCVLWVIINLTSPFEATAQLHWKVKMPQRSETNMTSLFLVPWNYFADESEPCGQEKTASQLYPETGSLPAEDQKYEESFDYDQSTTMQEKKPESWEGRLQRYMSGNYPKMTLGMWEINKNSFHLFRCNSIHFLVWHKKRKRGSLQPTQIYHQHHHQEKSSLQIWWVFIVFPVFHISGVGSHCHEDGYFRDQHNCNIFYYCSGFIRCDSGFP